MELFSRSLCDYVGSDLSGCESAEPAQGGFCSFLFIVGVAGERVQLQSTKRYNLQPLHNNASNGTETPFKRHLVSRTALKWMKM